MKPAHELTPLPEIPRKRYFAIGEVSELCGVKPHVLRYWEQEFPQLRPVKRRGNRRYYQQEDVLTVRRIRSLLYEEGFTITGARQRLRETHRELGHAANDSAPPEPVNGTSPAGRREELRKIRQELADLLHRWPN